jgi:Mce-associated membrane protein
MTSIPETDSSARASWRVWMVPGVLAAVLLALVAWSTVLVIDRRNADDLDQGAVEVARQQAKNFFTLDYRHADEDIKALLDLSTDEFKEKYAVKQDELVAAIVKNKVVETATVPEDGAAVEYLSGDRAQILVAVDVTIASGSRGSENTRPRTRIKLSRIDGEWLVSAIDQVG